MVLELFANCHNIYDSTKVDSATIPSLGKHTGYTVYMSTCLNCDPYYRNIKGFMATNSTSPVPQYYPKCICWIVAFQKWDVGSGIDG